LLNRIRSECVRFSSFMWTSSLWSIRIVLQMTLICFSSTRIICSISSWVHVVISHSSASNRMLIERWSQKREIRWFMHTTTTK
jgi:hypothetical protein